jgi:hypothetical protein
MQFAKVPIIAVLESNDLTPSAFRLFVYFCLRRNGHTGVCFPTLRRASDDLRINYSYACTIRKELVSKGWIEILEGRFIRPLKGFEIPNIGIEIPNITDDAEYIEIPNISIEIPNIGIEIPNESLEIPNHNRQVTDKLTDQVTDKVEKRTSKTKRATRVPDDFIVSDSLREWAMEKHPDVDLDDETESFLDHFRSVGGSKASKTDWDATWRNWIRRSKTFNRPPRAEKKKVITQEDHDAYWDRRFEEESNRAHSQQTQTHKRLGDGNA